MRWQTEAVLALQPLLSLKLYSEHRGEEFRYASFDQTGSKTLTP
jgi:hypothetical protein